MSSSSSSLDDGSRLVPAFIFAAVSSLCALVYFADRDVSAWTRLQVASAWTLALSVVAVVPLDVAATVSSDADASAASNTLASAWEVGYWSTYALTWVILPLCQSYEDCADFNAVERVRRAARENATFLGAMFAAVVLGGAVMLATEKLSLAAMRAYGIVLANVFGISTGVLLMGYGLVDVPRRIWRRASFNARVTWAYKRVAASSRALTTAHEKLARQAAAVEMTSRVMPRRHELRWAMTVIERETPSVGAARGENVDSNDEDTLEEDILTYDYDEYSDLVSLRRGLRRAVRVYERTKAQYVAAINEAFRAEAAEQSRASRRLYRPPNREGAAFSKCFDEIEFLWSIVLLPVVLRVIAAGLAFFSAAIVVAESTIWVGRAWAYADHASLLSVMLESAMASSSSASVHVVVAFPLFYMCLCTFYSLFKLGMFSFYQLVPRATDGFSLLVNASLVCRYAAPISYNFLMLLPIIKASGKQTTFSRKMEAKVPEMAAELNVIVPAFLCLFCVAIALGWFERAVSAFKAKSFTFNGDNGVCESTETGKSIVERERAEVQDGGEIGAQHEFFVGADVAEREQQLPPLSSDDGVDAERRARSNLLNARDVEANSSSSRWETQKARLSQAVQNARDSNAARASRSPLSQAGRDKVSKLDSMFSGLGRRDADDAA